MPKSFSASTKDASVNICYRPESMIPTYIVGRDTYIEYLFSHARIRQNSKMKSELTTDIIFFFHFFFCSHRPVVRPVDPRPSIPLASVLYFRPGWPLGGVGAGRRRTTRSNNRCISLTIHPLHHAIVERWTTISLLRRLGRISYPSSANIAIAWDCATTDD